MRVFEKWSKVYFNKYSYGPWMRSSKDELHRGIILKSNGLNRGSYVVEYMKDWKKFNESLSSTSLHDSIDDFKKAAVERIASTIERTKNEIKQKQEYIKAKKLELKDVQRFKS